MAIAVDQNYDKAQRKISTTNLEQFAGVDCQLLVEKETHRPIIMDGATVGGKFKCASTDELKAVETVANNAISQAYADEHYLGKTDKAVSAGTADTAGTAGSATKATQDASGNVITSTYATKTELTSGLSGKLGKTEKASSASTADAVAWTGVSGKPNFATVATSGSYNDLKNKPTINTINKPKPAGTQINVRYTVWGANGGDSYQFPNDALVQMIFDSSYNMLATLTIDNVSILALDNYEENLGMWYLVRAHQTLRGTMQRNGIGAGIVMKMFPLSYN